MSKATRKDPRQQFVPRYLPWLLGLVMLGVYGASLNHWINLFNLDQVARLSGWTWQPEVYNPLTYVLSWPLYWLPHRLVPLAANWLAAGTAALILGLLARSVALLPQDRTEAQRLRETSDFSFLTTPSAWLPPVLAVGLCGLQLTFWENATNFTGEEFNLLVFAFTVWSLLEYRLDEQENRLYLAAFVFGLGMAQDFGISGYFPALLGALIWIRGLSFFNARFLLNVVLCVLAGLALCLLLPTLAVAGGKLTHASWWTLLKLSLSPQWQMAKMFLRQSDFRYELGTVALTTLLPTLLMGFRWAAAFGDRSKLGSQLTGLFLSMMQAVILGVCLWGAFDPPFSGRHRGPGLPFLTFYYLSALSAGYYCGYFLLIARAVVPKKGQRRARQPWAPALEWGTLGVMILITAATLAGLVYKNWPIIQSANSGIMQNYARLMVSRLPAQGGMLLADSEASAYDSPRRLYLAEAALAQEGRERAFIAVDTLALNSADYHVYLHRKYPEKWPLVVDPKITPSVDPRGLLGLLQLLAQTNHLYYLHPSFGYYFETFYAEPRGLVYELKPLPEKGLPPAPAPAVVAENEAFWQAAEKAAFAPIVASVQPRDEFAKPQGLGPTLMARLHVQPEPNYNALIAGQYYSRSLNYWGVAMQRQGQLAAAAGHFTMARKLNPDNIAAGINLDFNHHLQARQPVALDLAKTTPDQFGKYRSWQEVIIADGPFDEPSFCFADARLYFEGSLLRQSLAAFARVRQLLPDDLTTLLSLGQLYVFQHAPDLALEALSDPLANPKKYGLNATNATEFNLTAAAAWYQKKDYDRANTLLETEIAQHPDDEPLQQTAVQVFFDQHQYSNAVTFIEHKLSQTNDPNWRFKLGIAQLCLNQYANGIATMDQVIAAQTNNYDAVFNRALAYLNTSNLPAARRDYQTLQKVYPQAYKVAFGLGEIAWRQHDTNPACAQYQIYLANAPTNTAEAKMIRQRLGDLQGKPH